MSGDKDFLIKAYEKCKKWQGWYENVRMPNKKGLVEVFCGHDTGHDNSPRKTGVKYKGGAIDKDASSYPFDDDVLPLIAPDVNAVYYGTLTALSDMAYELGKNDEADVWKRKAEEVKENLMKICYDENDMFFYDVDKNGNKRKYLSISITNVLSEHIPDKAMAEEICKKHLFNPDEFYTEYPFPAVAKSDVGFEQNKTGNSWNYYSQALTILRCTRWMDYYGYAKEFDTVLEKWVRQWTFSKTTKFGQELDPFTGEPSDCSEWYSSCMLVFIYAVRRLGII
jgi:hypothetical protein